MKKLFIWLIFLSVFPLSLRAQQSLAASGACAQIPVTGVATLGIQVTGTWATTLQPEVSIGGNAFVNTQVTPSTSSTAQSTITASGAYVASVAGYDVFQICFTSYASGTAVISYRPTSLVNAALFGTSGEEGSIPSGTTGYSLVYSSSSSVTPVPGAINASAQSGASIVEQTQAAATAATGSLGGVFIPAGNYTASDCASWQSGGDGTTAGVIIPSNVWIQGAGRGKTVITVNRISTDPACELFYAGTGVTGAHVSNLSIVWNDNLSSTINTVSTPVTLDCVQCEVDHVTFSTTGLAPDRDIEWHGASKGRDHDNIFLVATGTDGATGSSAVGIDAGNTPYPSTGVSIYNDLFVETSATGTPGSLLVITQSNVSATNNMFDLTASNPNLVNPVEAGQDQNGNMAAGLNFSGNTVRCQTCSIFGSVSNSSYTSNHFYGTTGGGAGVYFAQQTGNTVNATGATIAHNDFHKGSINLGAVVNAGTFIGRLTVAHNDIIDGNVTCGASPASNDISVTYNVIRYGQPGTDGQGINCSSATEVYGNVVKNAEAYSASGANQAIYVGGALTVFGNNLVVDDQLSNSTGTACSVASTSSTTCTGTATYWVHVTGSTWAQGSTNRCLFIAGTCDPISGFPAANYIQLDTPTAIASATAYVLKHTTFNAYEFNATAITQFNNNLTAGSFNGSGAQFDQTPTWVLRAGNSFDNGTVLNSGGTLNLGSANATVSQAGALTVTGFTCSGSPCPASGITYPSGTGIPQVISGTSWGTTISPGTGVVTALGAATNATGGLVTYSGALGTPTSGVVTNLTGTGAFNTSGTAANLSGTPALPSGTTATTQSSSDSSTKIATTSGVFSVFNTNFGLSSYTGSGLAADNIFQPVGSANGGIYLSGGGSGGGPSNQNNFAGLYLGTNGNGGGATTLYNFAYNHGTPTTALTSTNICAFSGITCNIQDGGTNLYAGNGSATGAFNNGITATTQAASDNSTKLETTAGTIAKLAAPPAIGGTTPNSATFTAQTVGNVGGTTGATTYLGAPSGSIAWGCNTATCGTIGASATVSAGGYRTTTNCSSSASPAVCGSAAAGTVALPTNAVSSSIVVNTTAVTANSEIFVQTDDTLGTKLGVTCNSTVATLVGGLTISARSAGASFTIANNVAIVTNRS